MRNKDNVDKITEVINSFLDEALSDIPNKDGSVDIFMPDINRIVESMKPENRLYIMAFLSGMSAVGVDFTDRKMLGVVFDTFLNSIMNSFKSYSREDMKPVVEKMKENALERFENVEEYKKEGEEMIQQIVSYLFTSEQQDNIPDLKDIGI